MHVGILPMAMVVEATLHIFYVSELTADTPTAEST